MTKISSTPTNTEFTPIGRRSSTMTSCQWKRCGKDKETARDIVLPVCEPDHEETYGGVEWTNILSELNSWMVKHLRVKPGGQIHGGTRRNREVARVRNLTRLIQGHCEPSKFASRTAHPCVPNRDILTLCMPLHLISS